MKKLKLFELESTANCILVFLSCTIPVFFIFMVLFVWME